MIRPIRKPRPFFKCASFLISAWHARNRSPSSPDFLILLVTCIAINWVYTIGNLHMFRQASLCSVAPWLFSTPCDTIYRRVRYKNLKNQVKKMSGSWYVRHEWGTQRPSKKGAAVPDVPNDSTMLIFFMCLVHVFLKTSSAINSAVFPADD